MGRKTKSELIDPEVWKGKSAFISSKNQNEIRVADWFIHKFES
jgi:hypothetical protein